MSSTEAVFFRPGFLPEADLKLLPEEISHLKALRIFQEDKIVILKDGKGLSCFFRVPTSSSKGQFLKSETREDLSRPAVIATAIPKGNRLEWLIQKGTELGITKFIFLNFAHSDRRDLNPERMGKVAAEACAQSGRDFLPSIRGPLELSAFLEESRKEGSELIVLDPTGKEFLGPETVQGKIPVIGPEGGFRAEEKELFEREKVRNYSAGDSILRIETAGIYAASLFRAFLTRS
ncbi:16S rRNA (uracil(1498)-N(3))-methyltransferase [Leptospira fluminis]|uniref:Ribosomal RNA small subunit methyltransferase E n=1 Tax=Leptospira fluminis TaxID=2484979 RepID=A0A4R9GMP1_9LEPT|nr:RsmE family RNA methyltransferase [Leptospira fluminis]TGK17437.1 16S rRNA (uracil(1498)-N(3))-methyltransferase [Leptospira fluminis]